MQTETIASNIPLKVRTAGNLVLKPKRGYYTGKAAKKVKGHACETFNIESAVRADSRKASNAMNLKNMVIY